MPRFEPDYAHLRHEMVRRQIAGRGVRDAHVLAAMAAVPRHLFVPFEQRHEAYDDTPLPIACGQTISQPYIVAAMIAALALQPGERVLDVGTGSGYAAAVLAHITKHVVTIERHAELAQFARDALAEAGYGHVEVVVGDGSLGAPDKAPFDAILVDAAAPAIPQALQAQLALGGRLVAPVGSSRALQRLVRVTRRGADDFVREELEEVRFVPLVGAQGWKDGGPGAA